MAAINQLYRHRHDTAPRGQGRDGAVDFHREKFVKPQARTAATAAAAADIIFVVDDHLSTLMDFRL